VKKYGYKRSARSTRTAPKETFARWDADHLKTKPRIAAYLDTCKEQAGDDSALLAAALGVKFTPTVA
jgi:hypothetical protein